MRRKWYGVEGDREVVSTLLREMSDRVERFETDLPLSHRTDWPPDIQQAATVLQETARKRPESDLYAATGVLENRRDALWQAFVLFAPYAYDASAWFIDGGRVSLSDGGTCCVQLSTEELETLAERFDLRPLR